jgi:hypothetical protein
MHLTCFTQNLLVDHLWRTATWAKSTARWFALFSAIPTDIGGGTELTGGSYARAQRDAANANYYATQGGVAGASSGTTSPGQTSNVAPITFPNPSANWLTASWFGIFDASSAGNLLAWDALSVPITVAAGDTQVTFNGGGFVFTID